MEKAIQLKSAHVEKISHLDYFNIAISIDCVILGFDKKDLKVLLIQSDLKEYEGLYSLLGDLISPDEDIVSASYRILKQRTGLNDVYLEQLMAFGSINRHPSGRVITIAYYSLIDINNHQLKLSHNNLHWHAVKDIKKLAFDHKLILDSCLSRLQSEIMEKPVIFNLLPEKFSLRQLQETYEAILGKALDRRNFRKKISLKDWLEDINELEDNVPYRPGKLYQLKKVFKKNNK